MAKGKKPTFGANVGNWQKDARGASRADAIATKPFCWRFSDPDMNGPWGWEKASVGEILGEIIPKLHDYESMTWAAMDGASGSHSIELDKLCKEAQERLSELGRGEQGQLFSLRITGERRVWGVKDVAILRVLWWDPKHEVCPSIKKHTLGRTLADWVFGRSISGQRWPFAFAAVNLWQHGIVALPKSYVRTVGRCMWLTIRMFQFVTGASRTACVAESFLSDGRGQGPT